MRGIIVILLSLFMCLPAWAATRYFQFGFKGFTTLNERSPQKFYQVCDCVDSCAISDIYVSMSMRPTADCLLSVRTQYGADLLAQKQVNLAHLPDGDKIVLLPLSEHRLLRVGDKVIIEISEQPNTVTAMDLAVGINIQLPENAND